MIFNVAGPECAGGVQQGPRGGGGGDLPARHLQAQLDQGPLLCTGIYGIYETRLMINCDLFDERGLSWWTECRI